MSRTTYNVMLSFIPHQHRLSHKQKKKNQFPFCWCSIASGANHLRTSQLSATALENGFGTKCEEHLFSSNYDYSTLTWPETYLTSIKNSTGSVITTNSSPSLTKSPRRAVRRETKDDEFPPWEEAESVCPFHDSAGTPNNLYNWTTAPSFTQLPHWHQISVIETPFPTLSNRDEWKVSVQSRNIHNIDLKQGYTYYHAFFNSFIWTAIANTWRFWLAISELHISVLKAYGPVRATEQDTESQLQWERNWRRTGQYLVLCTGMEFPREPPHIFPV